MKKTTIFGLCLLLFICSYAQKNLKESFIVLNSNDTLKGFIDYREWYRNPNSILFRLYKEKDAQRYNVKDIRCFTITGGESYQRYNVKISMDRQSMGDIGDKDTASRTDTVFLKVLQQGKNVTLFSYEDEVKQRLYILSSNESIPVELQNSEYLSNGQVISERQYRATLLSLSHKYIPAAKDIQAFIYNQNYSAKSIGDICYRINGLDRVTIKQEEKNKPSPFRFFVGIGINRGLLRFEGNSHYAGLTNEAVYEPVIYAGSDIFVNPAVGRMFLRSQLSVSRYKTAAYTYIIYNPPTDNYYLTFKQTNITLHEQLNYNLYNGHDFKWFIGAGAGLNFSLYSFNQEIYIRQWFSDTSTYINDNYANVRKLWLNACFRSGFAIRKFETALIYYPKSSITQEAQYQISNSSFQLHINYLFH